MVASFNDCASLVAFWLVSQPVSQFTNLKNTSNTMREVLENVQALKDPQASALEDTLAMVIYLSFNLRLLPRKVSLLKLTNRPKHLKLTVYIPCLTRGHLQYHKKFKWSGNTQVSGGSGRECRGRGMENKKYK